MGKSKKPLYHITNEERMAISSLPQEQKERAIAMIENDELFRDDKSPFSPEAKRFARLMIHPDYIAASESDFALASGLSLREVARLREDRAFVNYCHEIASRYLEKDIACETVSALRKSLRAGSTTGIKLALQTLGKLVEIKKMQIDEVDKNDSVAINDLQNAIDTLLVEVRGALNDEKEDSITH